MGIENIISSFPQIVDPVNGSYTEKNLNTILTEVETKRLTQIELYKSMYKGSHYDAIATDPYQVYANICFSFIEKGVSWLVGNPPSFVGREDIQSILTELYQEIMDNSGGDKLFFDAVQHGSITGDAVLQVSYDPTVNYDKGGVTIQLLDSQKVFLEYSSYGERKELSRVLLVQEEVDPTSNKVKVFIEIWSKDSVTVYPKSKPKSAINLSSSGNKQEKEETVAVGKGSRSFMEGTRFKNPYGELPFVHIQNYPISDSVYGRSDLHDLWVINKELNEALLDYKDNIKYNGNPITLLYGVSAKNIEKGPNKTWGNLPETAKIQNLEIKEGFEHIKRYMDTLLEFVGLSGIPYHLLGAKKEQISGTTGPVVQAHFLPLSEFMDKKRMTYGIGFAKAMEKGLRFMNQIYSLGLENLNDPNESLVKKLQEAEVPKELQAKVLALRSRPYYATETIFEDRLPKDRAALLADVVTEMANGLESTSGALRRLKVSNVEDKIEEILEEREYGILLESRKNYPESNYASPVSGLTNNEDLSEKDDKSEKEESPEKIEDRTNQSATSVRQKRVYGKAGVTR